MQQSLGKHPTRLSKVLSRTSPYLTRTKCQEEGETPNTAGMKKGTLIITAEVS